jgi:hypothetical protein
MMCFLRKNKINFASCCHPQNFRYDDCYSARAPRGDYFQLFLNCKFTIKIFKTFLVSQKSVVLLSVFVALEKSEEKKVGKK